MKPPFRHATKGTGDRSMGADRIYLYPWNGNVPLRAFAVFMKGQYYWQRPINPHTDTWAGPWELVR